MPRTGTRSTSRCRIWANAVIRAGADRWRSGRLLRSPTQPSVTCCCFATFVKLNEKWTATPVLALRQPVVRESGGATR